ncbi:hypothetical protein [Chryseobacterium sp. UNC8MFCol]|uniref:hypothetical protein n=1 Tax=Chryseobacterium sp. UNC8MFCol TaxID=1340435 RepID=UPI00048353C8|nr:hypothetical protein [Chryseobacterium sp. UNC8MFCol]
MNNLFIIIKDPFKVIGEDKSDFLIWFIFTILTGQFGILANFIVRYYTNGTNLRDSIYIESTNGSFYTFSIALIASILGPIFLNFIKNHRIEFRTLKTFTIIIAIFYLFLTGIIYASIQSKNNSILSLKNSSVDFTQAIIYVFAIVFASYGYCILRLEQSNIDFNNLNDPLFNEQNDENVEEILDAEPLLKNDPNGIQL